MINEFGADLDRNGYAPSILARTESKCFLCGCSDQKLDRHEIFHGAYRAKSKGYGIWVPLCHFRCHLNGVHKQADIDIELKRKAQLAAQRAYGWTPAEFIQRYGKNYL